VLLGLPLSTHALEGELDEVGVAVEALYTVELLSLLTYTRQEEDTTGEAWWSCWGSRC